MVAAPLLTTGVPLDLPQTGAQSLNLEKQPLVVSIKADGKVFLMETEITLEELVPKLQAVSKTGPDERIYLRGDKSIAYGRVAEVMAVLTTAGYRKVALVNEPLQQ
jgi:biopolymer transport protein TolR